MERIPVDKHDQKHFVKIIKNEKTNGAKPTSVNYSPATINGITVDFGS